MTAREMSERYLKSIGRHIDGDRGCLAPLMPILILGLFYDMHQDYCSEKKLKLWGEGNKWRKVLEKDYKALNKSFFRCFTEDEQVDISENIIGGLIDYCHNTIVKLRVCYRRMLGYGDDSELKVALLMCNLMIKLAGVYYKEVYLDRRGNKKESPEISKLERVHQKFMNAVCPNDITIYSEDDKDFSILLDNISREVVDYCFDND